MIHTSLPTSDAADAFREVCEQNPRLAAQTTAWIENGAKWSNVSTKGFSTIRLVILDDDTRQEHNLLTLEWDAESEADYFPGHGFWDI